ncbi:MAG TPA: hypothetical protein VJ646_04645 [Candidatus Binatia bacterium]|nr:hypothetical protein [Candidatus Binatia bacterium]
MGGFLTWVKARQRAPLLEVFGIPLLSKAGAVPADRNNMRTDLLRFDRTILQEAREVRPVSARRFGANDLTQLPRGHGLPALKVGQEIGALVIEELADGRIVLDLDGSLVEANNPGGLSAGQTLRLRVDLIEPQVTLQIVEPELAPEDEAAKFLRQHLPGPAAERESLAGLQAKIEAVSLFDVTHASLVRLEKLKHFLAELLNSKEPLDTARLMRWVRDGGLHYEAKLLRAVMENPERLAEIADHDLKALLLGALGELETNRLSGAPLNAIVSQLGDLESRQAVSLLAQLEGHAYQLQIPFFTAGGFSNLALSVERDGGGGRGRADDSAQGYNILFLLELEDFGRTRIDARLEGRNLRVIFYVEREDSIRLLTHEMSSLRETLLALGCREVLLSAWPLRAMPREQRPKFEALALGVPPDLQLLNVKV